jgi:hypothetical protein
LAANKIDESAWWECAACGHEFEIDSSPDLELCCECAEIRDAEVDVTAVLKAACAALNTVVDQLVEHTATLEGGAQ